MDNPTQAFPTLDNPTQLNTYRSNPNPKNKNLFIPQGANPYPSNPYPSSNQQGTYAPYQVAQLRQETKDRIGYEVLANAVNRERLDEIVELIVETLCSEKPVINIAGEEYPAELVKERLMQLDSTHIEYIFSCIKNRSHEIRNIKRYLLATLFNAPATISHYYDTQVRRDFGMC